MKTSKAHLKVTLLSLLTLFLFTACGNNEPPSLEERMNQGNPADQGAVPDEDAVSYELGEVQAEVSTSQGPLGFNAVQLSTMSSSCGNEPREEHFQNLIDQFQEANAQRTIYSFKYQGETQGTGTYQVFVLPNVPEYESIGAFEEDFKSCGAAARTQPADMNKEWLLFTGTCPPAGTGDSTLPNGCMEIKNQVDPTLELE